MGSQIYGLGRKHSTRVLLLVGLVVLAFLLILPLGQVWAADEGFALVGFNEEKVAPEDTILQFDFTNGFDKVLESNLGKIKVYAQESNVEVGISGHKFIKEGSITADGGKTRRLELMFNNLAPNTTYVVEFSADFAANNGSTLGEKYSFEFTTTLSEGEAVPEDEAGLAEETTVGEEIKVPDIEGHWAEPIIREALAHGWIEIDENGGFRPDQAMTRAELTAFLVKASQLESEVEAPVFKDTKGHWAEEHIAVAVARGIIKGYNENEFGPDDFITREQMAVIFARAANWEEEGEGVEFADSAEIAPWAKESVAAASVLGVMTGYEDNTFRPKERITRAEAITTVLKVF